MMRKEILSVANFIMEIRRMRGFVFLYVSFVDKQSKWRRVPKEADQMMQWRQRMQSPKNSQGSYVTGLAMPHIASSFLSPPRKGGGGGWRWAGRQNTFDCKIKHRHIHKNCNSAQLYDCLVRFALQKSRYLWCTSSLKIVKFVTKRAFIKICTVKIFEANDRRSYI